MKLSVLSTSIALLLLIGTAQAQTQPAAPTAGMIDATVRATIQRYQLPGIAVGVIEDGKVTFARGYGETIYGSRDHGWA